MYQSLVIYKEHQEKDITDVLWEVLEFKTCTESNICAVSIKYMLMVARCMVMHILVV